MPILKLCHNFIVNCPLKLNQFPLFSGLLKETRIALCSDANGLTVNETNCDSEKLPPLEMECNNTEAVRKRKISSLNSRQMAKEATRNADKYFHLFLFVMKAIKSIVKIMCVLG